MSDREKIADVLTHYATGIDSRDWSLFRRCFTEQCRCDYGKLGQWYDRESLTRYMMHCHSGPSLHRLSNLSIDISEQRATSRTYVDAVVTGPGGLGGAHTLGYYDDNLVLNDAGWQIAQRRFTPVRVKFLGLLSVIPPQLALMMAAAGSRRMNRIVQRQIADARR